MVSNTDLLACRARIIDDLLGAQALISAIRPSIIALTSDKQVLEASLLHISSLIERSVDDVQFSYFEYLNR
jgi:hypothetical protein